MKQITIIVFALLVLNSCTKHENEVDVTYRISKAFSTIAVAYVNEDGVMVGDTVNFESAEDLWSYSFTGEKGELIYVSGIYADSTSSVTIEVLLDGKIYKSGSSNNEPEKYVIVSGTIPY